MPAAVPLIAVVAGGVASAAVGGGIIGAIVGAGAAFVVSTIGASVFPAKRPTAPPPSAALRPGDDPTAPGAGRTQSFRQPITEHGIVFGDQAAHCCLISFGRLGDGSVFSLNSV